MALAPIAVAVQSGAPTPGSDAEALIRVKAVVTNRNGQTAAGLKAADFALQVDGKPEAVESVTASPARAPAPRTVAILLDEFHTAAADAVLARAALLRSLDQLVGPADQAMVVKPLDTLTTIQPTSDREAIRSAIAGFEGRKGDYTPRTSFERNYMAQAPAAVAAARAQVVSAALRAMAMTLAERPDAGSVIVLVGDGFARMHSSREMPATLQAAIRIANRADAPVYVLAPGLPDPEPGMPPVAARTSALAARPAASVPRDAPADPVLAALAALTTQTGGELIAGVTHFDSGLVRIRRDLDAHYVLTYRPAHGPDGRFHAVQVGVKRDGLQVKARTGYVAPMSAAVRVAASPPPSAPLRVLRRSALIHSWSGVVPSTPGRANVIFTWMPSLPRPGAVARARAATLVVTASTPDGTLLFDGAIGAVGSAPAGDRPIQASFDAPVGPVRVDVKILDAKGVVLDTDARDVAVTAPRPTGPTIYPPAVLSTRSAREFREVSTDPHAAPVPQREFRRTERLLIRAAAVDPSGVPMPVAAALLNRLRQPLLELSTLQAPLADSTTQFDLPLAALPPGDYAVRLTVTGASGSTAEYVMFRIVG